MKLSKLLTLTNIFSLTNKALRIAAKTHADRKLQQNPMLKFVSNPPRSPLGLCEGDCDSDGDCKGELKCFQRNTRLQSVPGCSPGEDDDNTSDFCYREISISPSISPPPTKFISHKLKFVSNPPRRPLGICEGDCDNDDDCTGQLKCFQRNKRLQPVPGCSSGGDDDNTSDYCYNEYGTLPPTSYPTTKPSSVPTISNYPSTTPTTPPTEIPRLTYRGENPQALLGLCEGNCKSDIDCKLGLSCFRRETFYTRVPGCTRGGDDYTTMDVCFQKFPSSQPTAYPTNIPTITKSPTSSPSLHPTDYPKLTYIGNPAKNLGLCEGDCDKDSDCQPGLQCYQGRRAGDTVPGCSDSGGDIKKRFDVCFQQLPSETPSKSPIPSTTPTTSSPTISPKPSSGPTPDPTAEHFAYDVMKEMSYFQLKQYWRKGYYWQESRSETKYCAESQSSKVGSVIEIERCSRKEKKQRWRFYSYNRFMIESVYKKGRCISLDRKRLKLDTCDMNDIRQRWDFNGKRDSKFEWHPLGESSTCVTNQHHPSSGEDLKIMSCRQAKKDQTNYWTIYD